MFSLCLLPYVLLPIQMKASRSYPRPQDVRQQFRALARFLPMVAGSLVEQFVSCGKGLVHPEADVGA